MRRLLFILFVLFLSFQLRADEYEMMRICKIDLVPCNLTANDVFDARALRVKLLTKAGGIFSQDEFDTDLKMLAADYAQVEPCILVEDEQLHIILKLWLKPKIRSIEFCGNDRVDTKKLLKEMTLTEGSAYDSEGFLEEFNKIRRLYVKKGYFESDLSYEVINHEDCNEVSIKATVIEGRAGKIKDICFEGLCKAEENEILDLMVSKKYSFLFTWYLGGGFYNPEMIDYDRTQVTNFFQNKGYADAVVDIRIHQPSECEAIVLVISVDKGCQYSIGHLSVKGNCEIGNLLIWNAFTFGQGSLYSPEAIRDSIQGVTDVYGTLGFIDAAVDIQLTLREDSTIYDVCVMIEEGEMFNVGIVKVFGNTCTSTNLILHENLMNPGNVFNMNKLKATEMRLLNTGYFKSVNVYAVKSNLESENCLYRDVYIEVEETDTGNVGMFFGFSSLERIFGGVEISEMNFNLAGLTKVVQKGPCALRGAGEYAHFKVNLGDKQTSYVLQWTKPYFLDTPWIIGVDLEQSNNRVLSQAYEVQNYGGSFHATYIKNAFLKYNLYYRGNHSHTAVEGNQNLLLEQEGSESGFISAVGLNIIYDSTDSPRKPTQGFRSRLVYELAGLGGNFSFMKFAYLNSYYYPLSKRGTFKFKLDLQFIHTYRTTKPTDLPFGERFFLGGETTVRGYRPFVIGPLFGNLEPRGGVSSMLITEEYQHNLLKAPCVDGFVFVDAGMVTLKQFTIAKYVASVGFGARFEAMRNMPVMIGVGWPIHPIVKVNNERINNAQRFFFSMGGNF
jgi:outer membrane protein insertion porin family